MPLKNYGVLKGKVVGAKPGGASSNHFHVLIDAAGVSYRIAINVYSQSTNNRDLQFFLAENFQHPITSQVKSLPVGFTEVAQQPDGQALDFIRGNLFDINQMVVIPRFQEGPDNDLNDKINFYIDRALRREATLYAFGETWGPENDRPDQYFGFLPGRGIHDIHMNQGNPNPGPHAWQNGVWQDGGFLIHFEPENNWVGYFLKFQSQSVHTDDLTGHPIPFDQPNLPEVRKGIRMLAALINPIGNDPGLEKILLFNPLPDTISLNGWGILDSTEKKETLSGTLAAGETKTITLSGRNAQLSNRGGLITLIDENGLKIHGVNYTEQDARASGQWLIF